jgi:hypothetical protein
MVKRRWKEPELDSYRGHNDNYPRKLAHNYWTTANLDHKCCCHSDYHISRYRWVLL